MSPEVRAALRKRLWCEVKTTPRRTPLATHSWRSMSESSSAMRRENRAGAPEAIRVKPFSAATEVSSVPNVWNCVCGGAAWPCRRETPSVDGGHAAAP